MTSPRWTILIATHAARMPRLVKLLDVLMPQVERANGLVTVEALWNNGERPLGQVRDDLMAHASAEYVCFVDDDDMLPLDYVQLILPALDGRADYVGFRVQTWANGLQLLPTIHSLRYAGWFGDKAGWYRDVSHLNPVRRSLAEGVSFGPPENDDFDWANAMRARLRGAREEFIDEVLYLYRYHTEDSVQQGSLTPLTGPGYLTRPVIDSPAFAWHPASTPDGLYLPGRTHASA